MRSWILGGLLTAVTTGGITFVATGAGNPSHCGPCESCRPIAKPDEAMNTDAEPNAVPRRLPPFVTYEEPPLANPHLRPERGVVPASFVEPIETPRIVAGEIAMATPNDPY